MAKLTEMAEVLMALATLSGGSFDLDHGKLDRALSVVGDHLPAPLRGNLSFSVTSVGFRCLELPEIVNMAFYMMAAEYGEDGNHNILRSKIPTNEAREIAIMYGSTIAEFERTAIEINHVIGQVAAEIAEDATGLSELDTGQSVNLDEVLDKARLIVETAEQRRSQIGL